MTIPIGQHQLELERNLRAWQAKPLLREIYAEFYRRIGEFLDLSVPGHIVELGSGIGNLKQHFPNAIATDLFPNPWLDLVCDAYEIPFHERTISNLVLFDVFHHLQRPKAFLREAARVLSPGGRLILFEPYLSFTSFPVYGMLHHEPLGWGQEIDLAETPPNPRPYYAAQGNATRLFFLHESPGWLSGWKVVEANAFSAFHYLLSGGYSKPAFYPVRWLRGLQELDKGLSGWPRLFGGRCLIVLTRD